MKLSKLHALVLPAAFWAAGCSLALDFSGDCTTDEGCNSLGENFACEGGVCVGRVTPPLCAEPVDVESGPCDDIYGPLENDANSTPESRLAAYMADREAYEVISVHTPRGGYAVAGKTIIEAAVRVAVEDVNRNRAFIGIEGNGRKLAALICDDGSGAIEGGIAAAEHAVDCGAKAIVATQDSEPTKQIYLQVARPKNVPLIAPGALSPAFPTVRTNGGTQANDELLWRVRVPGSTTAQATAAAIKGHDRHENVVVFFRAGATGELNPEGPALWDAFERELCNGNFCQANTVTDYGFTTASNLLIPEIAEFLRGRGDFDLVVTLVSDLDDILAVLTAVALVAAENVVADPESDYPEIVQVDGARSAQAPGVFLVSLANQMSAALTRERGLAVICNTAGVSSASEGDAYSSWLTGFDTQARGYLGLAEGQSIASQLVAPTAAYFDAVTMTAYAMAGAALSSADGQIDTAGIIGGLKRLSDTAKAGVPPFDWSAGITALRTRGASGQAPTMNYDGASGPVDFDQATGDVRNQLTDLWQYGISNQGMSASDFLVRTVQDRLSDGTAGGGDIEVDLTTLSSLARMGDACPDDAYPKLVPREMSGQ